MEKVKESILEDLETFIHLNQDDFDRGKGFNLIQRFISEKRDSAQSEALSVGNNESKENICSTCNGTGEVKDVSHVTWPCVDCHTEEKI